MATYKIKGQRYLRKYTENGTSPVYAASVQAQKIVDTFCEVPWTRTGVDSAQMTYHTEEIVDEDRKITGLEMNVDIRDRFDAALFCAGHHGGMHRAYANAAVYRYTMPDDAIGKTLVSLAARVTSDPYNSAGARLHVFTNSTGEIPMNCHVLRGESAAGELIEDGTTAAAVAKRTEKIVGKETYWYPTTETCALRPVDPSTLTSNLNLKKYLFLVVALESYSTVRGNWIEGCSFIANSVEIETSAAIDGLSETDLNDLRGQSEGESPSDITLRIVANADLKGKLWLQAVSYETKRILKKWSFECEFFYGQNEKIVNVPNASGDQELLAHHGGIFFEAWVGGEKYDVSNWYGCDNGREDHSIELTRTSAIFPRINLYEGKSGRRIVWGKDDGSDGIEIIDAAHTEEYVNSPTNSEPLSGGEKNHIRIAPYLISGTKQDTASNADARKPVEALIILPNRVVAEFDIDTQTRPYITEADFVTGDKFDIDWDGFEALLSNQKVIQAVGDVTAVKYGIVLGRDGTLPAHTADTTTACRVFSTLIERRYEPSGDARTLPTELNLREGGILYGGRPTFMWRLDEPTNVGVGGTPSAASFGCSYTAFKLQVWDAATDTLVYDSGLNRAPAKDAEGNFIWQAPLVAGAQTDLAKVFAKAGNWKWRVAMFNAKFKPYELAELDALNGWSKDRVRSYETSARPSLEEPFFVVMRITPLAPLLP